MTEVTEQQRIANCTAEISEVMNKHNCAFGVKCDSTSTDPSKQFEIIVMVRPEAVQKDVPEVKQ